MFFGGRRKTITRSRSGNKTRETREPCGNFQQIRTYILILIMGEQGNRARRKVFPGSGGAGPGSDSPSSFAETDDANAFLANLPFPLNIIAQIATSPLYFAILLALIAGARILHRWWTAKPPQVPNRVLAQRYASLKIMADRGSLGEGAPKNTRMAAREAVRERADGITLDVWLAKDGVLMALDPEDLQKIEEAKQQGRGPESWLSYELGALDAGQGEKIPTLEEILDTLAGTQLEIHLVLPKPFKKRASSIVPSKDAYDTELLGMLSDLLSRDKFRSFTPRMFIHGRSKPQLQLAQSALSHIPRFLTSDGLPPNWHSYLFPTGLITGFSMTISALPSLEPRMFPSGTRVLIGPINRPQFMDAAVRLGVSEMTTGMPGAVKQAVGLFVERFTILADEEDRQGGGSGAGAGAGAGQGSFEGPAATAVAAPSVGGVAGTGDAEDGEDAEEVPPASSSTAPASTSATPRRRKNKK